MRMRTAADAARFVDRCLDGEPISQAGVIVFGLDGERFPCGVALNERRASVTELSVHELLLVGEELQTDTLVLAEVVVGAGAAPCVEALQLFTRLSAECDRVGLVLLDAVTISRDNWWSWREDGATF